MVFPGERLVAFPADLVGSPLSVDTATGDSTFDLSFGKRFHDSLLDTVANRNAFRLAFMLHFDVVSVEKAVLSAT
jgi:hypothetical protein